MNKYCEQCHTLLQPNYTNDQLNFKCAQCELIYNYKPEDTLRYNRTKENNVIIFKKILDKAVDDPVTKKTYKKCIKCKNNIVKQIRIGEDMKLFNICIKCKTQWLN